MNDFKGKDLNDHSEFWKFEAYIVCMKFVQLSQFALVLEGVW